MFLYLNEIKKSQLATHMLQMVLRAPNLDLSDYCGGLYCVGYEGFLETGFLLHMGLCGRPFTCFPMLIKETALENLRKWCFPIT